MILYNKFTFFVSVLCFFFVLFFCPVLAFAGEPKEGSLSPDLEKIIKGMEKRYQGTAFSVRFVQETTIKSMDITEEARGNAIIKQPGMVYWEYTEPEKQLIVTNGNRLWIYKPAENQVTVGKTPVVFGEGKGAGFLTNIDQLRNNFEISLEEEDSDDYYILKLIPTDQSFDVKIIYLWISRDTYIISHMMTINSFGDETRIRFSGFKFGITPDDSRFVFDIPPDTEVVYMENE